MTHSEACYEAACSLSEKDDLSCCVVGEFSRSAFDIYSSLMAATGDVCPTCAGTKACSSEVEEAAESVHWEIKDFRTFMCLMASEALK